MTAIQIAATVMTVGLFGLVRPRAGFVMLIIGAGAYLLLGWIPFDGQSWITP